MSSFVCISVLVKERERVSERGWDCVREIFFNSTKMGTLKMAEPIKDRGNALVY